MGQNKKKSPTSDGTYHHGDLRNALLEAALAILQSEGLNGLSLRKVASAAGVSHGAPYRHFESKESLIAEIARIGFQGLADFGQRQIRKHQTARDRLLGYGLGYVLFAAEHPTHFKIMFGSTDLQLENYPELAKTSRYTFDLLVELVVDCQKENSIQSGDPYELAAVNWSYVHGLSHLLIGKKLHWLTATKGNRAMATSIWKKLDHYLIDGMGP